MKKLLIALMLFATPAFADVSTLVAKPIHCATHEQDGGNLFDTLKRDGLSPLMGMVGQTWTDKGDMIPADFYLFYDPEQSRWAFIELDSNIVCLIAAGDTVEFDPEVLQDLLNW